MKGFVPTPPAVVDLMIAKLFHDRVPRPSDRLLDPGSGRGAFIEGVLRWCDAHSAHVPRIRAVESDPVHVAHLRATFGHLSQVEVVHEDFLLDTQGSFDFIVGNPPYVSISGLSTQERNRYRTRYLAARGRFDLYLLFFEQACRLLSRDGRLVFITPEKFLYVETAAAVRSLLSDHDVEELHFLDEATFPGLVTYPLVTTLSKRARSSGSRVVQRDEYVRQVQLPQMGQSWQPTLRGLSPTTGDTTLADAAVRISCGVATGADSVYVADPASLPSELIPFSRPTVAGRELQGTLLPVPRSVMLLPYDRAGALLPPPAADALLDYLSMPSRRQKLLARTCVQTKPWYAFHETPPLLDILRPKILCKDISPRPAFVVDEAGSIVPRHSAYYVVPRDTRQLTALAEYLNSPTAREWLEAHCQRAANGFVRLQSHVLKRLPIPPELVGESPQREMFDANPLRQIA